VGGNSSVPLLPNGRASAEAGFFSWANEKKQIDDQEMYRTHFANGHLAHVADDAAGNL
jgi:hypothetical protein